MALAGADKITAEPRLTFGSTVLYDGFSIAIVAMGLFGIAEILRNLENPEHRPFAGDIIGSLLPDRNDMREAAGAIGRGSLLGTILGIIPGNGATISSFAAYTVEKKIAKDPARFGRGAIEGVAAPESANNAGAQTSFIPMLTLGIPPNPVMALMIGAMAIHGIVPGPLVMQKQPELFWGMIASMWLGNLMLVVINLPLIGIWVSLLRVPYRLLFPAILIFCAIGVYSVNNQMFEVLLTALFGVVGYVFMKLGCEPAPLLLGFILGPLMEENLRRALLLSRGDASVFATRPISAAMLVLAALLLATVILPAVRSKRAEIFTEES
jgi:putative tricarboxylic transport membrane protein